MEISEYEAIGLKKINKWEKQKHKGFHKKILDAAYRHKKKPSCQCLTTGQKNGRYRT